MLRHNGQCTARNAQESVLSKKPWTTRIDAVICAWTAALWHRHAQPYRSNGSQRTREHAQISAQLAA
jgi:hypothetical protein